MAAPLVLTWVTTHKEVELMEYTTWRLITMIRSVATKL